MSSKNLPWFRTYTEMVDDEKLRLLAFEDRWHFVALLCLKGNGLLDNECGHDLKMRRIAVKLGLSVREVEEVARRLAEVGLIERETLQPIAWENRQCQSDNSTSRVKAYRERQKSLKNNDETNETEVKRFSNGLDVDTDTEVDKEKEQKTDTVADGSGEPPSTGKKNTKPKISFDYETGKFTNVSEVQIESWRQAYPAISLDVEKAKAAAWLLANPANRKSNIASFLNRWFTKAQDSAPARGGTPAQSKSNRLPKSYGQSGRL